MFTYICLKSFTIHVHNEILKHVKKTRSFHQIPSIAMALELDPVLLHAEAGDLEALKVELEKALWNSSFFDESVLVLCIYIYNYLYTFVFYIHI